MFIFLPKVFDLLFHGSTDPHKVCVYETVWNISWGEADMTVCNRVRSDTIKTQHNETVTAIDFILCNKPFSIYTVVHLLPNWVAVLTIPDTKMYYL
jgi:hypothetical protein